MSKHAFDLEKRSTEFARQVVRLCKRLPRNPMNVRMTGQAVGSAGSVGANYREANDALGKKDFVHRLKNIPKRIEGKHPLVGTDRRSQP